MKAARKLQWLILGETLFLALSFLHSPNYALSNPGLQTVSATSLPTEIQVVKHQKTSHLKKSVPVGKSRNLESTTTKPAQLARTSLLEERGALERGDDRLPQDNSYYDVHEFEGRAGESVTIRLESRDFDTYLILVDPDNEPVAENDDATEGNSNSTLSVTLPKDGTYLAIVNSYDSRGEGRYTISVSGDRNTVTAREKPVPNQNNNPSNSNRPVSLDEEDRIIAQADRLYLQGNRQEAERLYRQVKPPFANERDRSSVSALISDPSQLSVAGQVYWRNAQEGWANGRESQVEEALKLLAEEAPNFAPAQAFAIEADIEDGNLEDAIARLEELTTLFPESPEFARLRIRALDEDGQDLEASIAARQFAIFNPNSPEAPEFIAIADDKLGDFRSGVREKMALRGLGGLAVGVLTGNTQSSVVQGIQLVQIVAMGESGLGEQVAEQVKRQATLVEDAVVVDYIDEIGQDVARYMGRDEFDYEFYVIEDDSLNAFALPGGKIFIHTGAITRANTEAELAGLLAHEVAHAVLSHGYEGVMTNLLLSNVGREIPLGNILSTLVSLDHSRSQETQADILGTRVLNSAGYAADGLRNLMATLYEEHGSRGPSFLSTHPASDDRVEYMEELIGRNGYNRYAFEGVEQLARIQARLR
ncbi:M48 family metalloprotease [Oscillatoriales cyanobacterium LEGE 11467]|uniref:M48 family metalloprotease n=1 Tax=Zarconia navalis LEGE 11467 TaxID=1828826 RepID=A0A928VVR8_9CYAN|nr:M48 family metalloprotease [Zarconia navalis]MBE9039632.1 M48 family metalloprotease [Zarconia navalis LEGE 11467]